MPRTANFVAEYASSMSVASMKPYISKAFLERLHGLRERTCREIMVYSTLFPGHGRCTCGGELSSLKKAHARAFIQSCKYNLRTDYSSTPPLRDHLFSCVLVAEHYAARVHRHLLVKRRHRCCIITIMVSDTRAPPWRVIYCNSLSKNGSKINTPALATIYTCCSVKRPRASGEIQMEKGG
jgi:hypothetical protein